MESVVIGLAMLATVLVSGTLASMLPWAIPLPLIQILLGVLVTAGFEHGVALNPDVFFLLFLPPLLFLDGWRAPKDALKRDGPAIFLLAFGLVIITVVVLGTIIHWLVPAIPLFVAFALAAIVSPTDAVAVSGITHRLAVPPRIRSVLEGEALFNDASGLVAFRVAVAAAVTGSFSLASTAASFVWVAGAGLVIGAVVTWLIIAVRNILAARFGQEPGSEILLSLLIPFAAYFLAEYINASGILAAVSAGMMMSYSELSGRTSATTRIRRRITWDMVQFTLNGIIFVLLGEQLPRIVLGAINVVQQTGHRDPWWLIVYAFVICCALVVLRFAWVYSSIWTARRIGHDFAPPGKRAGWRTMLVLTAGGVRGAVTLAGAMTLPLTLADGSPFPARDLTILLAATVLIMSLLGASLTLPKLLPGFAKPDKQADYTQRAKALAAAHTAAAQHSVNAADQLAKTQPNTDPTVYAAAAHRVQNDLLTLLGSPETFLEGQTPQTQHVSEYVIRRAAIDASRDAIYRLARRGEISDELARELVQLLDLDDIRLA